MRISDWSSDVCSADLAYACADERGRDGQPHGDHRPERQEQHDDGEDQADELGRNLCLLGVISPHLTAELDAETRSEENTFELQSLMSTSYAVIWLKKQKAQYGSVSCNMHRRYKQSRALL